MSVLCVKVWFQNRRAKYRKQEKQLVKSLTPSSAILPPSACNGMMRSLYGPCGGGPLLGHHHVHQSSGPSPAGPCAVGRGPPAPPPPPPCYPYGPSATPSAAAVAAAAAMSCYPSSMISSCSQFSSTGGMVGGGGHSPMSAGLGPMHPVCSGGVTVSSACGGSVTPGGGGVPPGCGGMSAATAAAMASSHHHHHHAGMPRLSMSMDYGLNLVGVELG